MTREIGLLLAAFAVGTVVAGILGAVSLGVALGVGQICFAGMLVFLLLR